MVYISPPEARISTSFPGIDALDALIETTFCDVGVAACSPAAWAVTVSRSTTQRVAVGRGVRVDVDVGIGDGVDVGAGVFVGRGVRVGRDVAESVVDMLGSGTIVAVGSAPAAGPNGSAAQPASMTAIKSHIPSIETNFFVAITHLSLLWNSGRRLLVTQRLNGVQSRRPCGRVDAKEEPDGRRETGGQRDGLGRHYCRQTFRQIAHDGRANHAK